MVRQPLIDGKHCVARVPSALHLGYEAFPASEGQRHQSLHGADITDAAASTRWHFCSAKAPPWSDIGTTPGSTAPSRYSVGGVGAGGRETVGYMRTPTPTLRWTGSSIEIIDQTRLPAELVMIDVSDVATAVDAIERLAIRGAPALGAFGALAVVVGLDEARPSSLGDAGAALERLRHRIGDARPTAVNLRWAVDRVIDRALADVDMLDSATGEQVARPDDVASGETDASATSHRVAGSEPSQSSYASERDVATLRERVLSEALAIGAEDARACSEIGRLGRELLARATVIATHCNTGRLATAGTGTALAVVYAKAAAGETVRVLAAETRPLLQGARLTAWELADADIDVSVVADGAMAGLIAGGKVDAVIVGADRIAANGDTANKVGTLAHALAAADAGIGFYVAAPTTTIDPAVPSGDSIVIEQRDPDEVHFARGPRLTPAGVEAVNPAFDVTPARLITAIITDAGVLQPPFEPAIADALAAVEAGSDRC